MTEAIVVAMITGCASVIGQFLIHYKNNKERDVDQAIREDRQNIKLASIENKLDEHNGYAQKFEIIQRDIALIKKDIEYLRKGK